MVSCARTVLSSRVLGGAAVLGLAVGALVGPGAALAHVVKTKDGKTYEGRVVSADDDRVVIDTTFSGRKEIARTDVASIDTTTPPLREQWEYRLGRATDVPGLVAVHDWGKRAGFTTDLAEVWRRVLQLEPGNVRARKALGHVLVGKTWMSPEEKAAADLAAHETAMRAKGLVPYEGRWVTPKEKEALERGLVRDGDEWVTEEVFHTRRGERKVDGRWVRVGEAEGKARAAEVSRAIGVSMTPLWGPHVDVMHELSPEDGQAVLAAAQGVADRFHRLLAPGPQDGLDGLRIEVGVPHKAPAYARYAQLVSKEVEAEKSAPGWTTGSAKGRSFWWGDPGRVGTYQFPALIGVVTSNVAHNVSRVLLLRYRYNYRFPSAWLDEGLAYHLEILTVGRTETFNIGRGGVPGGGDPTVWQDSRRWPDLLKAAVLAHQDTPVARLATTKEGGFSVVELAKAWSVVKFLVERDAAKFKAYVDGMKAARDGPEEQALLAAYGFDFRGLEAAWREHVAPSGPPAPPPSAPGEPGKQRSP